MTHDTAEPITFAVQIDGLPQASKTVRSISIDPVKVDAREIGPPNGDVRMLRPGAVSPLGATITCVVARGGSKELQLWWQDAAKGKSIRKNITVTLFQKAKPARSYTLNDCFPTQWSTVNFDTSSTVQTETLTVSVGRIEFST